VFPGYAPGKTPGLFEQKKNQNTPTCTKREKIQYSVGTTNTLHLSETVKVKKKKAFGSQPVDPRDHGINSVTGHEAKRGAHLLPPLTPGPTPGRAQ